MLQKFYYATMIDEELKIMLQGVFTTRSENFDPKSFFRWPVQAGRCWSYMSYNQHFYDGTRFIVGSPSSIYESNFVKAFRRGYIEQSEPYYLENQPPTSNLRERDENHA